MRSSSLRRRTDRRPNLRRRVAGWLFRYFAFQSSFPFPLWRYAERGSRTCPNGQHAEPYSLKVRIARHRPEIDDAARAKGSTGQRAPGFRARANGGRAKTPAYFVGVINIKNHEAYAAEEIGPGRASIEAHGGTPLVIGDVKESMDGSQVANRIVVVEFPSIEAVNAWRDSEDGARVREAIERNAVFHGYTVDHTLIWYSAATARCDLNHQSP